MKLIILRIVSGQADNPKDDNLHDPGSGVLDELRRFRAHEAGATYTEIAEACGPNWRTVKKYLSQPAVAGPPVGTPRKGSQPQVITRTRG